jgi:rSAM/selenodomain-associated transferase 1
MTKSALLVVAKQPSPGQTKTRLCPPLNPVQAAGLYECFLLDTLALIRQTTVNLRVLAYFPIEEREYFHHLAPDFELTPQTGKDLGVRLDQLTTRYLMLGYEQVVVMDSDSPTLPIAYLRTAFEQLAENTDVVVGPCLDGGYYLIGLKQPAPALLQGVQMSTSHVTVDTIAQAAQANLQIKLLPTWYDVDDRFALDFLITHLNRLPDDVALNTRRFLVAQFPKYKFLE